MTPDSDNFALIHDYLIECRGRGHCLPQSDIDCLRSWLVEAGSTEDLVLILSEELPPFYSEERTVPPSVKRISKKVIKRLREARERSRSLAAF